MPEPSDPAALLAAMEMRILQRFDTVLTELRLLASLQRNVLVLLERVAGKGYQPERSAGPPNEPSR